MNRPQVRIYTGNGEFIDREMNEEEFAQHLRDTEQAEAIKKANAQKESDRLSVLNRLGITEDEAKLLLG